MKCSDKDKEKRDGVRKGGRYGGSQLLQAIAFFAAIIASHNFFCRAPAQLPVSIADAKDLLKHPARRKQPNIIGQIQSRAYRHAVLRV